MKKAVVFLIICFIAMAYAVLQMSGRSPLTFLPACDFSTTWGAGRNQTCTCYGKKVDMTPANPTADTPRETVCLGIPTIKYIEPEAL